MKEEVKDLWRPRQACGLALGLGCLLERCPAMLPGRFRIVLIAFTTFCVVPLHRRTWAGVMHDSERRQHDCKVAHS